MCERECLCLYVHRYTYIVCIHICISICIFIYIYRYMYMYMYIYICMCVCLCVCACVRVSVSFSVSVSVSVCVCVVVGDHHRRRTCLQFVIRLLVCGHAFRYWTLTNTSNTIVTRLWSRRPYGNGPMGIACPLHTSALTEQTNMNIGAICHILRDLDIP